MVMKITNFYEKYSGTKTAMIYVWLVILVVLATSIVNANSPSNAFPTLCSEEWNQFIEKKLSTGDGHGHGPDIGSDEWRSVVEFKLGIRGDANVPKRDGKAWCSYIDRIMVLDSHISYVGNNADQKINRARPSYRCDKVRESSIEAMICNEEILSALDQKLANVYTNALKHESNQNLSLIKAEQRGWIKGRNDCWKEDDERLCVKEAYIQRIAELQAKYRLVKSRGPISFICDDNQLNEVLVTFFQTEPQTLIAEYGDSISLMYMKPSASGSKYEGGDKSFWEHHGEAMIIWGYQAPQMKCMKTP
jgi:uncharacterized protein